jgi:hypothetical protein
MKSLISRRSAAALGVGAAVSLLSATASAYVIDDEYWGGADHAPAWGDVIGEAGLFGVSGADVSRTGTELTVTIHTNFGPASGSKGGLGTFKPYTYNGKGIGFGDLLLSTVWNPAGIGSRYEADNALAAGTTLWSYGLVLDDPWSSTGGSADLYALNGSTNDANLELSDDYIKNATYRNGQAVAVDTRSSTVRDTDNDGTWSVINTGGNPLYDIQFKFDVADTLLSTARYIAIHWDPTCANDVIEGIAEVDEPAPLGLLITGTLLALGGIRRRRVPA